MFRKALPSFFSSVAIVVSVTLMMSIGARSVEVPVEGVEFKPLTLLFYYSLLGMPMAFVGSALVSAAIGPKLLRLKPGASILWTVAVASVCCALTIPWLLGSGSTPSLTLIGIGAAAGALGGVTYWGVSHLTRSITIE